MKPSSVNGTCQELKMTFSTCCTSNNFSMQGIARTAFVSFLSFFMLTLFVGWQVAQPPPPMASGVMVMSVSACPSGMTEVSAFNGYTLQATLAANGDAGTSFGSNSITPAGTVS